MSLIHTCKVNQVNPFDYLTTLQKHPSEGRTLPEFPAYHAGLSEGLDFEAFRDLLVNP